MKEEILKRLIAEPDTKHKVSDFETDYTAGLSKDEGKDMLTVCIEKLKDRCKANISLLIWLLGN